MDRCNSCITLPDDAKEEFIVFVEGDELYTSMLSAISKAQHSIQLETYIFAYDQIGKTFVSALAERARNGVEVRVLVDAVGSSRWSSQQLIKALRQSGVELHWFHTWSWQHPLRYNCRDHRKLLVVDSKVAFLGGFNIHKENSKNLSGDARWRDTHIRFTGIKANEASQLFDLFWSGHLREVVSQPATGSQLLHNQTLACRHRLRCEYASVFEQAKRSVYITTPYFVPDSYTINELIKTSNRGVDVKLLVPRKSDVRIALWASRSLYAPMLASGIEIYEFLPRILHAKTVVIDKTWSFIGTANLDYRSLFINYELTLVSANRHLSETLEEQFLYDLKEAEKVSSDQWFKRDLLARLAGLVASILKRWL